MIASDVEIALHWTCPSCGMEWVEAGSGFHGHRFSECLRCGTHARESVDARPAARQPPASAPRVERLLIRRR